MVWHQHASFHAFNHGQRPQLVENQGLRIDFGVTHLDIIKVFVVVASFLTRHVFVLPRHDEQHRHDEHIHRHLQAQQEKFPTAFVLTEITDGLPNGNAGVEQAWHNHRKHENQRDDCHDDADARPDERSRKGSTQQVLRQVVARKDEQSRQHQGQPDMHRRFLDEHPVNLATARAIAFADADFLRAFHHRGKHHENVVHHTDEQQQESHDGKDDDHIVHLGVGSMELVERHQKIAQLSAFFSLHFLQVLMRGLHLVDGIFK